jgi:hypothetical protein
MNTDPANDEQQEHFASLRKVTPLSKYLALVLFVALPFVGGWLGYQLASDREVTMAQNLDKKDWALPDYETQQIRSELDAIKNKLEKNHIEVFIEVEEINGETYIVVFSTSLEDTATHLYKITQHEGGWIESEVILNSYHLDQVNFFRPIDNIDWTTIEWIDGEL